MSDLVVLETKFKDHCKNTDKRIKNVEDDVKIINKTLITKVNWKTFTVILTISMSVVTGMWALTLYEVRDIRGTSNNTSENVSFIRGQLLGAEITK